MAEKDLASRILVGMALGGIGGLIFGLRAIFKAKNIRASGVSLDKGSISVIDAPIQTIFYTEDNKMLSLENETKKCQYCSETIKLEAKKCRFCGKVFDQGVVDKEVELRRSGISLEDEKKKCPMCAEMIGIKIVKCNFCGEVFDQEEVKLQVEERLTELFEFRKVKEGHKRCPNCRSWDTYNAFLPDGGFGPWCPHCKRPV